MKFIVDLTVPSNASPLVVADALLDLLTSQDDDAPYISCDGVDPYDPYDEFDEFVLPPADVPFSEGRP